MVDVCERLFEHLDQVSAETPKKKTVTWPLQMMLLILCPVSPPFHTSWEWRWR